MKLSEYRTDKWYTFDVVAHAISENWGLWLYFADDTLSAVRIRSYSPDDKTPMFLYPDKVASSADAGAQRPTNRLRGE